jgi:hypothetical protein
MAPGTQLVLTETDDGLMLLSRNELLKRVRADHAGLPSLADELIAERRAEAAREDEGRS